jgi:hypothetical protein
MSYWYVLAEVDAGSEVVLIMLLEAYCGVDE